MRDGGLVDTMQDTAPARLLARLRGAVFPLAFVAVVGLLAGLSTRYSLRFDWTADGRNTLSVASRELLADVPGPVAITAFARPQPKLRQEIADLVARYRRYKRDLTLAFVDPDSDPDRARKLGIMAPGTLLVEYRGGSERVERLSERALSNALVRLARRGRRRLVALVGHGERRLVGRANHDLGNWGKRLEERGFILHELDLAQVAGVPGNTSVLLLAGPRVDLLPGAAAIVDAFVAAGGNLLWLADPGSPRGLGALASRLGIRFEPGTVVDPSVSRAGLDDPRMALVSRYPSHPITRRFELLTLFPRAVAIRIDESAGWEPVRLLTSGDRAWSDTDPPRARPRFDPDRDVRGPRVLGVALERARPGESDFRQRVVVIGDGDFLSNAYLGNGGNLALGTRIVDWLARDDVLVDIPVRATPDRTLDLSRAAALAIGLGSLLAAPLALFGIGFAVWWWRRRL